NLESLPIRIECFDISNIQGQEIVGSMVVFEDAVAKKAHYRKFAVRGLDGQDDFGAMREVITRRFSRLAADPASDDWNESFAATPNLVVIDGGKGQLSAALAAMQDLDLPRVAVIALAKRIEEVFVPGRSGPILLPPESPGLQLLQRIRDEAHRFAITFHRQRRNAAARTSMFDQLEGVGPVRRRALLQHFGSAERVAEATQEELEGVPGVPAKTARKIYAQLHRTGRASPAGRRSGPARRGAAVGPGTSGRTSSAMRRRRAARGSRTSPRRSSSTGSRTRRSCSASSTSASSCPCSSFPPGRAPSPIGSTVAACCSRRSSVRPR